MVGVAVTGASMVKAVPADWTSAWRGTGAGFRGGATRDTTAAGGAA